MDRLKERPCPHCGKPAQREGNRCYPFCSERCKVIDLGNWAAERCRIADRETADEEIETAESSGGGGSDTSGGKVLH